MQQPKVIWKTWTMVELPDFQETVINLVNKGFALINVGYYQSFTYYTDLTRVGWK